MRGTRLILSLLLTGAAVLLGLLLLRSLGALGPQATARPQPVHAGDQEIAWIHAATNSSTWERFVAGVLHLKDSWPDLVVDAAAAFPEQSAAVPEIMLTFAGRPHRLRVRWYKLTSETGIGQWVGALAGRAPPPLAIIGGGSSDRARDLALALRDQQAWRGQPPLLLITTATADLVAVEAGAPAAVKLTDVYPNRTFRFCFQNSQMAEAVVDFVWGRPDLRPDAGPAYAVGWSDDPYSLDLADRFQTALSAAERGPTAVEQYNIPYSVGDYNEPNRYEADLVRMLAQAVARAPAQRRLLVLPTLVHPARRVLRKLTVAAPAAARHGVVATGDSINFNNIYRDRDVAWNVQEMPAALVFFCHQDPVSDSAKDWRGADPARGYASATDDVLLNAEMMQLVVDAAYGSNGLLDRATADGMAERLRDRQPPFFGADGNRLGGRGEFVVCLRPVLRGEEVLPDATVEVWRRDDGRPGDLRWLPHRAFRIEYDVRAREGGPADAAP